MTDKKKAPKKSKKMLHPALQANADKLRNGEPLSPGSKNSSAARKKRLKSTAAKKRG